MSEVELQPFTLKGRLQEWVFIPMLSITCLLSVDSDFSVLRAVKPQDLSGSQTFYKTPVGTSQGDGDE